jgi:hypothetical protein
MAKLNKKEVAHPEHLFGSRQRAAWCQKFPKRHCIKDNEEKA